MENMITEAPPPLQHLTELIQSLEQASHMAKQLPTTSDADHRRIIFSALNSAVASLSSFISVHNSDDGGGENGGDEPMMIADDGGGGGGGEEEEMSSKDSTMEKVEEKMREFLYIQNKRPKRPLSPVAAAMAERQGFEERESVRVPVAEFDPVETRLRNLDLVYQFHA
ncbi:uncharacterized protein LOC141586046 [Silene latifolia]|uniref:uncharacterized protein LOC141586046 n=1 Tax=Silene latifolia TaxID=37657 RepID=UPI003D77BB47